ncbi:putative ABC-type nitrate transporter [Helianthus annuus]|nr:putative ABC-type nitrate transporter [Helianthus annuus]
MAWHHSAKMSALWFVPQLFLMGAGEAFSYGPLEFFITEAPERMKSIGTGLFLSTRAMGYFLSSLLVSTTNIATQANWLQYDLNRGKLVNFYVMLAVLGVFNFLAFFYVASKHQYKSIRSDKTNSSEIEFTNIGNV